MRVEHAAVAQDVIEDDQAAPPGQFQARVIVDAVVFLVGVDEAEIERTPDPLETFHRGADPHFDFAVMLALGKIALGDVSSHPVDLASHDGAALGQRLGQRQSAVAGEHADF